MIVCSDQYAVGCNPVSATPLINTSDRIRFALFNPRTGRRMRRLHVCDVDGGRCGSNLSIHCLDIRHPVRGANALWHRGLVRGISAACLRGPARSRQGWKPSPSPASSVCAGAPPEVAPPLIRRRNSGSGPPVSGRYPAGPSSSQAWPRPRTVRQFRNSLAPLGAYHKASSDNLPITGKKTGRGSSFPAVHLP